MKTAKIKEEFSHADRPIQVGSKISKEEKSEELGSGVLMLPKDCMPSTRRATSYYMDKSRNAWRYPAVFLVP